MAELGGLRVVGSLPSGAPGETVVCAFPSPSGGFLPVLVRRVMHAGAPPGSDGAAQQLRRAQLVRNHNVVQVVDVVQDGAGVAGVYAAFPGITLAVLLREAAITATPIPGPLAVHLVTEICKGLHAIHEATDPSGAPLEMLHTDLTPDSVWLSWDGDVRVMDLGLANPSVQARAMEGNESRVWFISPELARGGQPDRRSDVYSAAAILYRLVTGRPPYSGTTAAETVRLIVETPLPDARSVAPMLPPALGDMLSTGMAKNPAERFQSASAFGSTLQRFLDLARLTATAADLGAFLSRLMPEGHPLRTAWTAPVLQAFDAGPSSTNAPSALPAVDVSALSMGSDGASMPGAMSPPQRRATLPMTPMPVVPAQEAPVMVEEEMSLSAMAEQVRQGTPSPPAYSRSDVLGGGPEPVPPVPDGDVGLMLEPVQDAGDSLFGGEAAVPLPAPPRRDDDGAIALPGGHHQAPEAIALPGGHHQAPEAIALPGGHHAAPEAIALPGGHHAPSAPPAMPMPSAPAPSPTVDDLFGSGPAPTPAQPLPLLDADALSAPPPAPPTTLPPGMARPADSLVPGSNSSVDNTPIINRKPKSGGGLGMVLGGAGILAAGAAAWFFLLGPGAEPDVETPPVIAKNNPPPPPVEKTPPPPPPVEKTPENTPPPPVEKTPENTPPPPVEKTPENTPPPPPVEKTPDAEKLPPPPPPPVEKTPDVEKLPPPPPPPVENEKGLKFPTGMGALGVTAPNGSNIFINGKKMPFTTPVDPLFLRPGTYRIKVTKSGQKQQLKETVTITEKTLSEVTLEEPAAEPVAEPPPPPPPPPSKKAKTPDETQPGGDEDAPRKTSSKRRPPPPPPPPPPPQ